MKGALFERYSMDSIHLTKLIKRMKNTHYVLVIIIFFLGLISCLDQKKISENQSILTTDEVSFTWSLDSLDISNGISFITHTISNNGKDSLGIEWGLYYNQIMGGPDQSSLPSSVNVTKMSGTFFRITPTSEFPNLAPNTSYSYSYKMNVPVIRKSDVPIGIYIVSGDDSPKSLNNIVVKGLESEDLTGLKVESPESRFKENSLYSKADMNISEMIIPSPKGMKLSEGNLTLNNSISYTASEGLENEIFWLKRILGQSFDGSLTEEINGNIKLELDTEKSMKEGAYILGIDGQGISITSSNKSGILYGISSLSQLINAGHYQDKSMELVFPYLSINDSPDYDYRGLMLDVSRNFHSVESVKSILDMMAFYKLNKFHFHLGDDEGWRVEINDLPELTEVGGRRGHTTNEVKSGYLQPAYGSGPHPSPDLSYGSGWYSRSEYIDLIRYAGERHIEVIPEFDMPGHARAAIIAMKVRYNKYMKEGNKKEAEKYLLSDPNDSSEYNSAQGYGDNSFCVCRESTFTFVEKVLQEVIAMHDEAGVPLKTFHSGGDEVAYGSWQKSPICQDFLKANSESISSTDELQPYFTQRYMSIIAKYGLVTAGWEEYALKNSSEGHHGKELNPKFFGQNMQPYVWNATWGWGREDMAYQLANAGHKVVMCNSAQLYFDMAYNMDPDESGLMWTGMVDATNPFYLIPEDIYAIPQKKNNVGAVVNDDLFTNHVRLTDEGKKNFLGIQGHLWSETVTSNDKIQYYLFPKTLSLSERAWNAYPEWGNIESKEERWAEMQEDWARFTNVVGQHHMPILDHLFGTINYRIPLPGIQKIERKIHANVRYPGLVLRYTTDGSEVTETSDIYSSPLDADNKIKTIKMKAFATNGRSSRTSELDL